jgi:DNA replication protein DnaC
MTTTTQSIPTTRACDECGTVAPYQPLIYHGLDGPMDFARHLPFACQACTDRAEEAEREAAREAIRQRRLQTWERIVPQKYRATDVDHPSFPKPLWQQIRNLDLRQNLGLIGPAGRGKTRMLALVARRAIASDLYLGWCPANSFQWAATREFDKEDGADARRWIKNWTRCDVLILDDLGKHRWTDCVESAFFGLLEARASACLTTHWSMNPDPADISNLPSLIATDQNGVLSRALDPEGKAAARPRFAPIVSRLLDETDTIPVL